MQFKSASKCIQCIKWLEAAQLLSSLDAVVDAVDALNTTSMIGCNGCTSLRECILHPSECLRMIFEDWMQCLDAVLGCSLDVGRFGWFGCGGVCELSNPGGVCDLSNWVGVCDLSKKFWVCDLSNLITLPDLTPWHSVKHYRETLS